MVNVIYWTLIIIAVSMLITAGMALAGGTPVYWFAAPIAMLLLLVAFCISPLRN